MPVRRASAAAAPRLVLDMGTGSGCVAVSIARLCPQARLVAVDLSAKALEVARANAHRHQVADRIDFLAGDAWNALEQGMSFDLIVSNPPYVVPGDPDLWPEARDFDPPEALYGGADGLVFYRRLTDGLAERLRPGGAVMVEVGMGQARPVAALLSAALPGKRSQFISDGGEVERVVTVT